MLESVKDDSPTHEFQLKEEKKDVGQKMVANISSAADSMVREDDLSDRFCYDEQKVVREMPADIVVASPRL